ncbi:hypothetical protein ABH931_006850 [Streptacidiphilus sp. MAP12-33]|uniref:hypothetical protein n=1 Tax=Streptacidiphilus sp. MAP12-33 TaxID=3156266 RepID=UPI003514AEEA
MSTTATKRTRWKMAAGAGVAAAAATGVALSGVASASTTTGAVDPSVTAKTAQRTTTAQPAVERVLVGQGRMGAVTWKVDLEYYRHLPPGFRVPSFPPGIKTPKYTGLVCERMYLNGVRIDHQGGPWADCSPVTGAHQPIGEESLNGLTDKGTSGYRLFVGQPMAPVAYAVLTFTNGRTYRANTVHLPGTAFGAFTIPIGKGWYIRSVDTYSRDGHRLSHETEWH